MRHCVADTPAYVLVLAPIRAERARSHGRRAVFVASFALVSLVTFLAGPAFAHAEIVAATPEPGVGLAQAPGALVLKFSEPLNRELSTIEVIDRAGRDVGQGRTLAVEGDPDAMQRKLGFLRPGAYRVRWTTVSTLDGHVLKGGYSFGIGTTTSLSEQIESNPVASEGWVGLVGRFLAISGLGLWFGAFALSGVAIRGGLSPERLRRLRASGPVLALGGTALAVISSAIVASGSLRALDGVLLSSASGRFRLAVLAASALGCIATLGARRSGWREVSGPLAIVALLAEAASGHAAATTLPLWATLSLSVHLAAVGVWIFAIFSVVLSTPRIVEALRAFSSYAIGAAIAVAMTGLLNTAFELADPSDLTGTTYGRVLSFKMFALVAMAVLGYAHFLRRREPKGETRDLRDLAIGELGFGVLALALATVLIGFPNPPRQDAVAEARAHSDSLGYLHSRDAVSVAAGSGPFIVALTVLGARPGPVEFRVRIIGVEPGDALRDAHVTATSAAQPSRDFRLRGCGIGCFRGNGQIDAAATWRLETNITSNRVAVRTSAAIPFPTQRGTAVLARSINAMAKLRSMQIDEQLRSSIVSPALLARYTFAAPDRFEYAIANGGAQIQIGRRQFSRDAATGPWTETPEVSPDVDPGFSWPGRYFRDIWASPAAARIIGTDTIDGVATQVVAFVRADVPAWFRLWIGTTDHLVHRMEMRAEGHLMRQHFVEFNAPVRILPPVNLQPHRRTP